MQFSRTNPILAVHHEPQSREPLIQAERRFLKECASFQGESWLRVSHVALPHARLCEESHLLSAATWAGNLAIGPAKLYHQLAAVVEVLKVDDGLLKCLYAFHALTIR